MAEFNVGMPTSEWYYREFTVIDRFLDENREIDKEVELELIDDLREAIRLYQCFSLKERLEEKHDTNFDLPFHDEPAHEYISRLVGEVSVILSNR